MCHLQHVKPAIVQHLCHRARQASFGVPDRCSDVLPCCIRLVVPVVHAELLVCVWGGRMVAAFAWRLVLLHVHCAFSKPCQHRGRGVFIQAVACVMRQNACAMRLERSDGFICCRATWQERHAATVERKPCSFQASALKTAFEN